MSVTVWSKKPCVQCNAVKIAFDKAGVVYEEKDLPSEPDQLDAFLKAGHMQAPVVEAVGHKTFSGFVPDAVAAIAAEYGTK